LELGTGVLEHQDNVIVRLWAGRLAGLGETQPLEGFQGCTESQATIVPLIRERLAPVLIGRSPFEVERIVRDMEAAIAGSPYAKAAVVDALYDLNAKAYGVPLHQLLGGLYRDRIPVVWTIGIQDRRRMADEARWALGRGFRLVKVKIGSAHAAEDIENVAAVRDAVGPEVGRLDLRDEARQARRDLRGAADRGDRPGGLASDLPGRAAGDERGLRDRRAFLRGHLERLARRGLSRRAGGLAGRRHREAPA